MTLFHNVVAHRFRCQLMSGIRVLVAAFCLLSGGAVLADMAERQDEAAYLARGGDYDGALAILTQLRADYPNATSVLYDEVVILVWAGSNEQALATASELVMDNTPAWVAVAAGKAARDTQRFDTSLLWYDSAIKNEPGNLDARLGLAMALSDAGRAADARATLKQTPPSVQETTPVLLTSAYLFQREGMYIPAVNEYDRILGVDPYQPEALQGKAYALQALGLPVQALEMAQAHPGLMTEADMERLQGDALALGLRRAMQQPNQVYPYTAINLALAHIDEALAEVPPGSPLALQLRYDRVVGRTEALRTLEAIADYEAMLEEGLEPPAYVHYAGARSYLQRERPEEALQALEIAEQTAPNDLEIQIEKFYAYISLARYEEAIDLADNLVAQLEPVVQEEGSKVAIPNETRTRARIIASMGRAYADQLGEAEQMIDELLAEAPSNNSARYSLGNIYRYRGWQERSLPEYNQVLTMDPKLLPARTSYAQAKIEQQEYPQAQSELRTVQPMHPGNRAVMNLNEDWLLYQSWQLLVEANWGESTGDVFGTDQHQINAWLFTKPVKDNFRFYVRTFDNYADFTDGFGSESRRRIALGTDYRRGVWTARGEVNWNRTEGGDVGFAGRVDYRINDEWTAGGILEIDSYLTQLRASREGIKSNVLGGDIRYVRDESFSAGAAVGVQDYDDGNIQLALGGDSQLRFVNRFKYKLDGLANIGVTTNSKGGETVYYAPERQAELTVGVRNIWQQYRRYDAGLTHRLTGLVGVNNQKDFGSDLIWTLAYEFEWNINESIDLVGGVSEAKRYYDGTPENQTFFNARLNARF